MIDAAFGQGEVVVSGEVEPDTYVLAKSGPTLLHVRVGTKDFKLVRGADGKDLHVDLSPTRRAVACSPTSEAVELARLGLATEQHYGSPQDTEWAIADGKTYMVQSRPITTLGATPASADPEVEIGRLADPGARRLARRAPWARCASCSRADEGDQLLAGEILVAPMTSPDWVPTMRRAAALVTDGGGITCHAAIVSRELGVPCVVGARNATTVLRDGELVTVDGAQGVVYEGDVTRALALRQWRPERRDTQVAAHPGRVRGHAAGHAALRQPRLRRARRGGGGARRRRRRTAARRVHGHRRAGRRAPASC